MKIHEIGTGYTPIPAQMGAATEIVVEELVKAFQKQSADVELIDIQAQVRAENDLPITEVPVPKCFSDTDVKLGVMHKLKRVVYSVALARKLKKILKNSQDRVLLHFHNQYNLFFFLKIVSKKLRQKAEIAYSVHSYIWPADWDEIKDVVRKRYFQEIFCVQNADYVLVLNERTIEHFINNLGVRPERIYKVGNGVNTGIYHTLEKADVETFKCDVGLDGYQVVFQVGSVCDRKNQLGAIKMLRDYLKDHPNVAYVYAGGVIDSEYQAEIQRFAEENGLKEQVRYVGELRPGEELNRYYNAADVTVFPSKIESFGLVIIESISSGTPVILNGRPLFALEHGWEVYDSADTFVRLVDSHLQNPCKTQEGREAVISQYSWEKIAADHFAIWSKQEDKNV